MSSQIQWKGRLKITGSQRCSSLYLREQECFLLCLPENRLFQKCKMYNDCIAVSVYDNNTKSNVKLIRFQNSKGVQMQDQVFLQLSELQDYLLTCMYNELFQVGMFSAKRSEICLLRKFIYANNLLPVLMRGKKSNNCIKWLLQFDLLERGKKKPK